MISLPSLPWRSASKRLLYLGNDQVWAYAWAAGQLSAGRRFGTDRAGLSALATHLADGPGGPVLLVADLVEEDFHRQSLPHVSGKAGRNLLARKLAQQYRDTPYRYATVQGREDEGRRDDLVLFSALTNPAAVLPVVQLLDLMKLPLAGIYSLTALSTPLVAKLAPGQEHVLLVTQQHGGLRHSYFHHGQLKFSRQTPAHDQDDPDAVPDVAGETAKTRQFLGNSRLLARGDVLEATVLCTAAQSARLEVLCVDESDLHYHFVDFGQASALLDLPQLVSATFAEQLLLAKLARRPRPSHYALGSAGRFHQLWLARSVLYGASAAALLVSALFLCFNLVLGIQATFAGSRLRDEAAASEQRNRVQAATLPAVPTLPANMKAAVQIDTMLARQAPMPAPLLALVSQALDQAPLITLSRVDWSAGDGATGADTGTGSATVVKGPVPSSLFGLPSAPVQRLQLEAEVELPPGQERQVLEAMTLFAQALARQPRLAVSIAQAPVDVRADMKLAGTAGGTGPQNRPRFILNLVWKP